MYRNLFTAWYCLGVLALCLGAFLILVPLIGPDRARGSFGFLGLLGLLPFFWFVVFRKEKNDERDTSFLQRSLVFGGVHGFSTIFVVNSGLTFVYTVSGLDSVSLSVFWIPSLIGLAVAILAFSVTLLIFYYKGEHARIEDY